MSLAALMDAHTVFPAWSGFGRLSFVSGPRESRTSPAPPADAAALQARCLRGDAPAWAELVRAHQSRVYTLCYRFTGSPHDAEDLTQDVFLKVYASLRAFDPARGSLGVWIATVTRNHLVDHYRRRRLERASSSLDEHWDEPEQAALQLEDARPGPTDRRVGGQLHLRRRRPRCAFAPRSCRRARPAAPTAAAPSSPPPAARPAARPPAVQLALTRVSPELREAVILRDLQDMDYKDIARVLAIPEGTVKSRIARGRAELARLLASRREEAN